jgi:hypothetical protein
VAGYFDHRPRRCIVTVVTRTGRDTAEFMPMNSG